MVNDNDDEAFYVEVFNQYVSGLKNLGTFSHLDVISYLHQSKGYSLTVMPPWKKGEGSERQVGLFASRSPNRPSPLGLTTVNIKKIKGNRIYTSPMDLFDATPVVDIKPHIGSLDVTESRVGNDGWLEDSDHLRLHKEGVPHRHNAEKTVLHEAQDILIDITGAAFGLQYLGIPPERILCNMPVSVGGGKIRFSHGLLPVPAPAVTAILKKHRIPHVTGPVDVELLTPTGAALLAAMKPEWTHLQGAFSGEDGWRKLKTAFGMGTKKLDRPNVLKVSLLEKNG
jgi:tRNA-Thr(GGU) m(6)t(6)A37 methyltransferase TsaA